jgi:HlyD family secretion protein
MGYAGVVELDERVLAFELAGRVKEVDVRRGDRVEAGGRIAALDAGLERATKVAREREVEGAEAQVTVLKAGARSADVRALAAEVKAAATRVAQLERDLAREKDLFAKGAVPRIAVDNLESQLDQANWQKAALEQRLVSLQQGARGEEIDVARAKAKALEANVEFVEERLSRYELRAPIDGVILDVHAKVGEVLSPGVPVATLGEPTAPYVDVFVPEGELAGIKQGVHAQVRVDALADSLPGKVQYVFQHTEFTPRFLFSERERPNLVVRVRVDVDDPEGRLPVGVPAFVTFEP